MLIKKKNRFGFTLVEMTIVIGIFLIVFVIAISNFRKGERNYDLSLATQNLASDIRKMQTESLTGIIEEEINALGGFGVYLSLATSTEYILFRDNGDQEYNSEKDTIIQRVVLPDHIDISNLSFNEKPTSTLAIIFKPPKPTVYLNNSSAASTTIFLNSSLIDNRHGEINIYQFTGKVDNALVSE